MKIGEYVRDYDGTIGLIYAKLAKGPNGPENVQHYVVIDILQKLGPDRTIIKIEDVKSHSFNIIDLIEAGDYVNGHRVEEIIDGTTEKIFAIDKDVLVKGIFASEIKTIMTKENYEKDVIKLEEV